MQNFRQRRSERYGWLILVVSFLVVFGALGLARFGYSILLPSMQEGLGLDNAQAGGLATADLIGYLILSVLGGLLAARFGCRIIISGGLVLTALGMLCTGLSDGFIAAVCSRFINGLGSGASNVPVMALLTAWFAKSRRGTAAGIAAGVGCRGRWYAWYVAVEDESNVEHSTSDIAL